MDLSSLEGWLVPAGILLASLVVGLVVRSRVAHRLSRLSRRTRTDLDDLIFAAVQRHLPLWFVLGGLALAAHYAPLTPLSAALRQDVRHGVTALFFVSLSFVAANLITGLVTRATERAGASFVSASLTRNVLRGLILIVGGLLVLDNLGIEIKPLLTALGVGSLAVALALQPTLSNLFAGLHITLAKPLRIGDFVELENGVQGFVVDIGWRSTTLREPFNNLVIVPNSRLVEMISKNYSLPEPDQTVLVQVGVSYSSDLERVEAVTRAVAREVVGSLPEASPNFEPLVRYHTFADSAINFAVVLRVRTFADRGVVIHELVKRLKARYEREGIEIPFPQRVVHTRAAAP
jgi:small-conductance mechanosensitive channel